jgi:hypothetical protein
MAINVQCTSCGRLYRLKDAMAGKRARCKSCAAIMRIPTLSEIASRPPEPAEEHPVTPESERAAPADEALAPEAPDDARSERLPVLDEWSAQEEPVESPPPRISLGPTQDAPTSGLATASLMLGIVSMVPVINVLTCLPAIATGIVARIQIKRSVEGIGGKGKATAGIVLGILSIVLSIAIVAGYFLVAKYIYQKAVPEEMPEIDMTHPVDAVKKSASRGVLTQMGYIMLMYAMSNDEQFPDSLDHLVQSDYINERFTYMPKASGKPSQYRYIYLGRGKKTTDFPGTIVAHGRPEAYDGEGCYVLYVNGEVEWVTPIELNEKRVKQGHPPYETPAEEEHRQKAEQ